MTSHVILFPVIVDNRRFRVVILAVFSDSIVKFVGPFANLMYHFWDFSLHIWVFSLRPVVLIANICPSYLLVEVIPFCLLLDVLYCSLLHFLLRLFFFLRCLLGLFLVELFAAVEIGPVGFLAEDIERLCCNFEDSFRWIELFD